MEIWRILGKQHANLLDLLECHDISLLPGTKEVVVVVMTQLEIWKPGWNNSSQSYATGIGHGSRTVTV